MKKKYILLLLATYAFLMQSVVQAQDGRIVGGHDANISDWPSTAALMWGEHQGCAGSLIDKNWILTAAHCVKSSKPYFIQPDSVILGQSDLTEPDGGEQITFKRIVIHPNYTSINNDNDIALIELSTPSRQPPVPLIIPTEMGLLQPGSPMTVVGWGTLSEGGWKSDILQEAKVELIDQKICSDWYSNIHAEITINQFCAGFEQGKVDACQGDSGGPIFTDINGDRVQTGIVSWGDGCAREERPGVYTRISNYLDWIQDIVALNLLKNGSFIAPGTQISSFSQYSGLTPNYGHTGAKNWTYWSNSKGYLNTQLLPSTLIAENNMLQVQTSGALNGIVQVFAPIDTGPDHVSGSVWVYIERGEVGVGIGNGGDVHISTKLTHTGRWECIEVENTVSPANEIVIYSTSPEGADFIVDSAHVVAAESDQNPCQL